MRRKVKRITALLLVMVMLAGDASLTYAAEEPQATVDKVQESEQEGTGEIAEQEEQGEAEEGQDDQAEAAETVQMADTVSGEYTYTVSGVNATITGYTGSAASLTLPEELDGYTVQAVGDNAFSGCLTLTSVEIPESVEKIGNYAFDNCVNLKTVTLHNGLVTAGREFMRGTGVTEITLPESLTSADNALGGAQDLKKVIFADGAKTVPAQLFRRYDIDDAGSDISEVVMPESVTQIGFSAFYNCDALTEITLPGSLETIGGYAFYDCDALAGISFPENVLEIGERSFTSCDSLLDVAFGEAGTDKTVGDSAFVDCISLKEIELPGEVVSLGREVFAGCTSLASITLQNGLKTIGREFLRDTAVTEITLPESLTSADYALGGAQDLKKVIFADGAKTVPAQLFRRYDTDDAGSDISEVVMPESVTQIGFSAFYNCDALTEITLPGSLETIGGYAFYDCDALAGICFPETVTDIGERAFENCEVLSEVTFADGVRTIMYRAFADCPMITEIRLPASVASIGWEAFAGCSGLRDIILNEGLETIDRRFISGTRVESLTIPKTVTSMSYTLSGAASLLSVTFAQGMKEIPASAVAKYASGDPNFNIRDIYLPDTAEKIGWDALRDFTGTLHITNEDSKAAFLAIDNELHYQAKVTGIYDKEGRCLDRDKTYYRTTMSSSTNSGYINLVLGYSFKEEEAELVDASDMELTIKLPAEGVVQASSFKLNGEEYPIVSDEDGYIVIPVTETEGTISFSLQLPDTQYMMSYAELTYHYDGEEKTEPIGIVNMGGNPLTLSVPDETGSSVVKVSGIAQPDNQVDLYLEGTKAATVTASRTGVYSAEILLAENPTDGDMFKIEARTSYGGKETTATAYTEFREEAVQLTRFDMYFWNDSYDLLSVGDKRPLYTWEPDVFTFVVAFNHNDKVGEVQVVSSKNGEERVLEARWNEAEQAFVAADDFSDYVPGTLSVRYGNALGAAYDGAPAVTESVYREENIIGHESQVALNDISEFYYLKEQETGIGTLPDAEVTRVDVEGQSGYLNPETVYVERGSKTYGCQEMYIPEADGTYTLIRLGIGLDNTATAEAALYSIAQTWPMADGAVDTAKEVKKLIDLLAEESEDPDDAEVQALVRKTLDQAEETFEYGSKEYAKVQELQTRLDVVELINSSNEAYNKVNKVIENASHYSDDPDILPSDDITEEMTKAVDTMEKLSDSVANKELQRILEEMADGGLFSDSLVEKLLDDVWEDMKEEIELNPKWAIDPSGYVYEAFPENRLEGVKTTIYYQDPETKGSVLWNAAEYDQSNPLYTNSNGSYAWDVPEGLWQVKYEREGYETAYSEWLPVPPPQLDVNIGMVSLAEPQVESLTVFSDRAEVVFSKYMIPESLQEMKLLDGNGNEVAAILEYDEAGESEDGTLLAKEFVLRLDGDSMLEPGSSCSLVLSGLEKSYADVAALQGETVAEVLQNLEIIAPDEVTVKMGETLDVPVYLAGNQEGLSLEAVSGYEQLMTVQDVRNTSVKIYGKLYGEAELILRVSGTDIQKTVKVTIGRVTQDVEVQPTVVLPQSVYTVNAGDGLKIVPEVYPAGAAEGTWSIVSGEGVVTVEENTVTAKKAGEAVLRYTLDTANGLDEEAVYAECRILVREETAFVRGDADGDGKADISDLRLVLRHVCRKTVLEDTAFEAADVTDDDKVDIQDLRKILRFVCRKITEL